MAKKRKAEVADGWMEGAKMTASRIKRAKGKWCGSCWSMMGSELR